MKKMINFAVVTVMTVLCAVVMWSCSAGSEYDANGKKNEPTFVLKPRFLSCIIPRIDYTTDGKVVQTRSAYDPSEREGFLVVTSYHEFKALLGTDTIKHTYQGIFEVNAFDTNKTRYAHKIDIFKSPVINLETLSDGRTLNVVTFKDTDTHDFDVALVEELPKYEEEYFQVGDSLFKLCKNERILLELIDSKVESITSPDEKYNAYTVGLYFQYGLSEGPDNKKSFLIRLPQVLVPKAGPDVEIPDDKHSVVAFEDENKGYDNVNDSVNNRWIDMVKVLSDGSREPFPRVAFVSKNHLYAPEYQIKQVDDFDWKSSPMKSFDATPSGDWQKRENNIYVMPMTQSCATYTDKGTCVFTGDFDGQAYFVDSLGQKHYFLYKEYTFEDDGWQRSDMQPTENFERKLLSSDIRGFFNGATLPRTGEIELRKTKEDIKVIGYSYPEDEKGLETIVPNESYKTWRNQYTVFSTGKKEFNGKVWTTLYLKTIAPEKQTVTVSDWDIKDLSAQPYDGVRGTSRTDKQETGTFTIYSWTKNFVTRTNKSEDKFITTYDGTVKFVDKYNNEVEFPSLAVKQEDLGGVKTLKDLNEENDMERKLMTTSIKVTETNTSTSANHAAEVLFQKPIEKEELLSWDKEQSLDPAGNGLWTSTTTIIYNWKLAGRKTEPISVTLDWSIVGEPKSHVILAEAKAPYTTFNDGNWSNPTASYPQDGVTLQTSTKTYSEDYTNLNDKYTAKKQTASFKKVVDGKEITFDFLAPSSMAISHASDNLVDGKRTTTDNGITYDVYDHTGSVTATVTGNGKSQTQSATDSKEIWVKHEEPAPVVECKYGFVDASLVFNPNVSIDNSKGGFHVCIALKGETEWIIAVTRTYGNPNAADFDTYRFPFTQVPSSYKINSAILWDGHWIPAYLSGFGQNWSYGGYNDQVVNMNMQFAETCGIKNFTGSSTAENTARLNYTYRVTDDGTLHVYNHKGGEVYSIK